MTRYRGGGTGEAGEAAASPEFRAFTTDKFSASWIYEGENFLCFTGKKLVPTSLPGGSEQVKQVKQLLHRKSEAESAKNLAIWQIYPVFFLAASPEILLFLPPCI